MLQTLLFYACKINQHRLIRYGCIVLYRYSDYDYGVKQLSINGTILISFGKPFLYCLRCVVFIDIFPSTQKKSLFHVPQCIEKEQKLATYIFKGNINCP